MIITVKMSKENLKLFLFITLLILSVIPVMAQQEQNNFFIAPRADFSLYGRNNPTIGSGLCFGYDGKIGAIGLNVVYIIPIGSEKEETINAFEFTVLARGYLRDLGKGNYATTGPFFQFNAGLIVFGFENEIKTFNRIAPSFGLSFGWRIPFAKRFYAEPAVRLGFPYGPAGELAIGVRF